MAAERKADEIKAAQKRDPQSKPVRQFETPDHEVALRLREMYPHQQVRVSQVGQTYVGESEQGFGPEVSQIVQSERKELIQQGLDPDAKCEKRRQERYETLAAR